MLLKEKLISDHENEALGYNSLILFFSWDWWLCNLRILEIEEGSKKCSSDMTKLVTTVTGHQANQAVRFYMYIEPYCLLQNTVKRTQWVIAHP